MIDEPPLTQPGTQSLKHRLIDLGFAAGWKVAGRVPRRPLLRVVDAVTGTIAARRTGSYAQLRANLRQVIGPAVSEAYLDDLVVRGVQSYTRYWTEALSLPKWDLDEVLRRTDVVGIEALRECKAQGRGAVIALTHSGNWDAASVVLTRGIPLPMTSVAERLDPESLYWRFKAYRESIGMQILPLTGGDPPTQVVLNQRLRAGECISLLVDRDITGKGIQVELCGRTTTMPPGPALSAIQTGAALVPFEIGFAKDGWTAKFHPEIEIPTEGRLRERVTTATRELAGVLSGVIQRNPADWHMVQPLWPGVGPEVPSTTEIDG